MAAAEQLREEFIRELERMKMKYQVVDEADNIVRVSFGLDEMAVTVFVDFDENEDRARAVHFSAPLVAEFDEENLAEIFVVVNGLNNRFRFVKWVIDADMCTISCEADEFLFGGAGKACVCRLAAIVRIAEEGVTSLGDLVTPRTSDDVMRKIYEVLRERYEEE